MPFCEGCVCRQYRAIPVIELIPLHPTGPEFPAPDRRHEATGGALKPGMRLIASLT